MAAWALVPTQSAEIIKKVSLQSEAMFSQKLFLIYLKKHTQKVLKPEQNLQPLKDKNNPEENKPWILFYHNISFFSLVYESLIRDSNQIYRFPTTVQASK